MSGRYSGYPATVHFGTTNPISLRQMEQYSFSPNGSKSFLTPGGSLDRLHVGLASAQPMHRFATRDLETILANIANPTIGIASISGDSTPAATWRWQQRLCESAFQIGANHVHTTTARGYIKPVSLTASEDDKQGALMSLEYYSISTDGITNPDAKVAAVNFSISPVPTFTSRFFHGPTYFGGSQVLEIDGSTVNFGINANSKLFSNVFPRCYAVTHRDPSITFTGTQVALDAALSKYINNANTGGGGWVQYLRRGVDKNARVADASTVHISIAVTAGEWCIDEESWSGTDDGQVSVDVQAVAATLAIGLNVAIP